MEQFEKAIDHRQSEQVKRLVATTDVLSMQKSPGNTLIAAVLFCDTATVQALIDKGVRVNSRVLVNEKETSETASGYTALDYAVIHRRSDMVKMLLRNGADVTLKSYGKVPIDYLKEPPNIYWERGAQRVGTDAHIAHLLREAQLKRSRHR